MKTIQVYFGMWAQEWPMALLYTWAQLIIWGIIVALVVGSFIIPWTWVVALIFVPPLLAVSGGWANQITYIYY